jgi:ribosomal-protein-serine acetyltransferase
MTITIDKHLKLELTSVKHAEGLYEALNNSRQHLSAFLPWVDKMQTVNDFRNYIRNCELLYEEKKEVSFVMLYDDSPVGRIGLHHMNLQNKNASVGYWLTKNMEGKGIVIRSCKELLAYGFEVLDLNRIELKAAVENLRSLAVAEKLGFTKEGIAREAELVNNKFLDLTLYSMLSSEWRETKSR